MAASITGSGRKAPSRPTACKTASIRNSQRDGTIGTPSLRAARVIEAVVLRGHSGLVEVEVVGNVVIAKGPGGLPTSREVVEAVARALGCLQSILH